LQTLTLNDCTNVIPIAKALGSASEQVVMNGIKIEPEALEGEAVETMTLDSLQLNNVSLIKMDVENYEYHVLEGAKETLLKNRPILIFECWIGKDYAKSAPLEKANFDRVVSLIESLGYDIYVIFSNDFIAFPKEMTTHREKFKKLDFNDFDLGIR